MSLFFKDFINVDIQMVKFINSIWFNSYSEYKSHNTTLNHPYGNLIVEKRMPVFISKLIVLSTQEFSHREGISAKRLQKHL